MSIFYGFRNDMSNACMLLEVNWLCHITQFCLEKTFRYLYISKNIACNYVRKISLSGFTNWKQKLKEKNTKVMRNLPRLELDLPSFDVCEQGLPYKMYEECMSNNCGPQDLPHPSPCMVLNPSLSTWLSLFCK